MRTTTTTSSVTSTQRLIRIILLDQEELNIYREGKPKVKELFQQVCEHLQLREEEYFGLAQFIDGECQFVDLETKLQKLVSPKTWKSSSQKGGEEQPMLTLHFRVQFYVDHVAVLKERITRYLYFLQLRENLLNCKHLLSDDRCFSLAAYALQADHGNYVTERHVGQYFDPREYFPAWVVSRWGHEYIMRYIPAMHRDLQGMTRSEAQVRFIRDTTQQPTAHNIHFYPLRMRKKKGEEKKEEMGHAWLGICPHGIEIYGELNGFKDLLTQFLWKSVGKLYYDKKKFEIRLSGSVGDRRFTYYTNSDEQSKYLLAMCQATHMFQLSMQPRLAEIRHMEAEDKRYREQYVYSDSKDLQWAREHSSASSSKQSLSLSTLASSSSRLLGPIPGCSGSSSRIMGQTNINRYSMISTGSSNTTSGIVSDRDRPSQDESEDDRSQEIIIDSPPQPGNVGATKAFPQLALRGRHGPSPNISPIVRSHPVSRSSSNQSQKSAKLSLVPEHPELHAPDGQLVHTPKPADASIQRVTFAPSMTVNSNPVVRHIGGQVISGVATTAAPHGPTKTSTPISTTGPSHITGRSEPTPVSSHPTLGASASASSQAVLNPSLPQQVHLATSTPVMPHGYSPVISGVATPVTVAGYTNTPLQSEHTVAPVRNLVHPFMQQQLQQQQQQQLQQQQQQQLQQQLEQQLQQQQLEEQLQQQQQLEQQLQHQHQQQQLEQQLHQQQQFEQQLQQQQLEEQLQQQQLQQQLQQQQLEEHLQQQQLQQQLQQYQQQQHQQQHSVPVSLVQRIQLTQPNRPPQPVPVSSQIPQTSYLVPHTSVYQDSYSVQQISTAEYRDYINQQSGLPPHPHPHLTSQHQQQQQQQEYLAHMPQYSQTLDSLVPHLSLSTTSLQHQPDYANLQQLAPSGVDVSPQSSYHAVDHTYANDIMLQPVLTYSNVQNPGAEAAAAVTSQYEYTGDYPTMVVTRQSEEPNSLPTSQYTPQYLDVDPQQLILPVEVASTAAAVPVTSSTASGAYALPPVSSQTETSSDVAMPTLAPPSDFQDPPEKREEGAVGYSGHHGIGLHSNVLNHSQPNLAHVGLNDHEDSCQPSENCPTHGMRPEVLAEIRKLTNKNIPFLQALCKDKSLNVCTCEKGKLEEKKKRLSYSHPPNTNLLMEPGTSQRPMSWHLNWDQTLRVFEELQISGGSAASGAGTSGQMYGNGVLGGSTSHLNGQVNGSVTALFPPRITSGGHSPNNSTETVPHDAGISIA